MNYTLHQLEIFLKVCEFRSITKASEELYLTQPAVSIQLKKLQDQFPISLTEVVGRQLYITDFGQEIANAARKIFKEVDSIAYKANIHKGVLSGNLKLSIVSTGKYVMPFFLKGFMDQYTSVDLSMDVTNKKKVIEDLEENKVDFSLVSVIPEKLKLNTIPLLENKLYLVGKKNDQTPPLTARKILRTKPLIFREKGSATRGLMQDFLDKTNTKTTKKIELTSNEAVKQAVIAGLGYSIMPLIGIRNEIKNGSLEIIEDKDLPITTNWNLVWLKDKKSNPLTQAFIDYIQENKTALVQSEFLWYQDFTK